MLSVLRSRTRPVLLYSIRHVRSNPASSSRSYVSTARRVWSTYTSLLEKHPLSVKIVTGGVIAGLGDVICQLVVEDERRLNVKRVAIFTCLSGGLISPLLHAWYGLLNTRLPGVSAAVIAKRLALDQLGFAPVFLPIFLASVMTLEGHAQLIPDKLRAEWWPVTKANWGVWVPAQFVNFRFVPGSMQVLFSNVVGLLWNAYLSHVSHSKLPKYPLNEAKSTDVDKAQI